jgi:hypothetical protein
MFGEGKKVLMDTFGRVDRQYGPVRAGTFTILWFLKLTEGN